MKIPAFLRLFILLLAAHLAIAQSPRNRTYMGQDVYVASGQQVHNAICLFCSVQVEGELTGHVLVLFGSLNVSGHIVGGATVVGGNAVVDSQARIGGDAFVLGGNAVYETDEALSGSVYVVGGHMSHFAHDPSKGASRRFSLSPRPFIILAALLLAGLLAAGFFPRLRHNAAVRQRV